jgi:hypothetical protein
VENPNSTDFIPEKYFDLIAQPEMEVLDSFGLEVVEIGRNFCS